MASPLIEEVLSEGEKEKEEGGHKMGRNRRN